MKSFRFLIGHKKNRLCMGPDIMNVPMCLPGPLYTYIKNNYLILDKHCREIHRQATRLRTQPTSEQQAPGGKVPKTQDRCQKQVTVTVERARNGSLEQPALNTPPPFYLTKTLQEIAIRFSYIPHKNNYYKYRGCSSTNKGESNHLQSPHIYIKNNHISDSTKTKKYIKWIRLSFLKMFLDWLGLKVNISRYKSYLLYYKEVTATEAGSNTGGAIRKNHKYLVIRLIALFKYGFQMGIREAMKWVKEKVVLKIRYYNILQTSILYQLFGMFGPCRYGKRG